MKKLLFYSLIFIFATSLSACLNIKRDIRFNAQGKGNEKMTILLGSEFMSMMSEFAKMDDTGKTDPYDDKKIIKDIDSSLKSIPGITVNKISSVVNKDSSNLLNVDYDFDNLSSFASAMLGVDEKSDSLVSFYTVGDSVYFSYIVNMNNGTPEDTTGIDMKNAYKDLFKNDKLIIKIDLPYKVAYSNGTSSAGNKITWEIPMISVMGNDKMIIKAVMVK